MQELLLYIAKNLVNDADEVSVDVKENDRFIDCKLTVGKGDLGKVIGRNGKIAAAIRTVARAYGRKQNKKVNIKIDEN